MSRFWSWLFPCRFNDPRCREAPFGCRCGKGTTVVQAAPPPPTPAPPTAAQSAEEFARIYPQLLNTYIETMPRQLAAEYEAIKRYTPELTRVAYEAERDLYPETAGLQEMLAARARQGMTEGVPASVREEYLDQLNAGLGYNVASPVAADYRSRGLLNLQESWRRYYTDLALSTTNRLPLQQATAPAIPQAGVFGFGPQQVFGYNAQNYGTYAGTMASLYGSSTQSLYATPGRGSAYGGAAGGALGGALLGAKFGSIVPGIGTAIGAGVGAIGGGIYGATR